MWSGWQGSPVGAAEARRGESVAHRCPEGSSHDFLLFCGCGGFIWCVRVCVEGKHGNDIRKNTWAGEVRHVSRSSMNSVVCAFPPGASVLDGAKACICVYLR